MAGHGRGLGLGCYGCRERVVEILHSGLWRTCHAFPAVRVEDVALVAACAPLTAYIHLQACHAAFSGNAMLDA